MINNNIDYYPELCFTVIIETNLFYNVFMFLLLVVK